MKIVFDQKVARSYDEWYETDFGKYAASAQNELMMNLLKPLPGQSLLDIGCGTGNHLRLFGKSGVDAAGLEPSVFMLKRAKEKQEGECKLMLARGEQLPIKDDAFDLSILFTTLEFCQDPAEVLKEVGRVTKKRIFIGVLNCWSFLAVARRIKGCFHSSIYDKAQFYSLWKLKRVLKRSLRFNSLSWGSVGFFPFLNLKLFRWLEKRLYCRKNPFASFLGVSIEL
jgi:ubiquinone/menaquinone biosynthesis C-methylase UbiE